MLKKINYFRNLEILHEKGIYINGDIVEIVLESIDIHPSSYALNGDALYNKQHVANLISKLSLETIHKIVKDSNLKDTKQL